MLFQGFHKAGAKYSFAALSKANGRESGVWTIQTIRLPSSSRSVPTVGKNSEVILVFFDTPAYKGHGKECFFLSFVYLSGLLAKFLRFVKLLNAGVFHCFEAYAVRYSA
jgi:hypothetical protein